MIFQNRHEAGMRLAELLKSYRNQNATVYALPRGGVALGVPVANSLKAPLDLIVVRKIGHPNNPEYAIAAVAADGHIHENMAETRAIDREWFESARRTQQAEACRRRDLYLSGHAPVKSEGRTAIIVDDGLATGLTMALAIREVRHRHPSKVVVAVPVAPSETIAELRELADEVVVLHEANDEFYAIGAYYADFPQLTDAEVVNLMDASSVPG